MAPTGAVIKPKKVWNVKPQVGDEWEVRVPGKRRKVKIIGDIYKRWIGLFPNQKRVLYAAWRRANKGRYTGISVASLKRFGKRLSTAAERTAAQEKRWKEKGII
jgi:hypothetical protein